MYFNYSNGYLDSEGWKVFSLIRRVILRSKPYLAKQFKGITRNSSYEQVVKFLLEDVIYLTISEESELSIVVARV
jgi:hypothetical protein